MTVDPADARRTAEIWRQYVYWVHLRDLLTPLWAIAFKEGLVEDVAGFSIGDLPAVRDLVSAFNRVLMSRTIRHCPGLTAGLDQLRAIKNFDEFVIALDEYVATWIENHVA